MDRDAKDRLRATIGGHFLVDLYSPILPIILPALITNMGLSFFLAGAIVTVYNVTSSLVQPVAGLYSDRTGWRASIPLCILISCLGISFSVLAGNYLVMLILVSAAALGTALFHPAAMESVNRLSPPYKLGVYNSIFTTSGSISYAFGPLIAGILITFFGLSSIAWMVIPGIIGAVWIYRIEKSRVSMHDTQVFRKRPAEPVQRERYWWVPAGLVVTLCSLRAWAYIGIITYLPALLILGKNGMDTVTTSFIVTVMLCTGVGGQIAGGYLSDRFGRKNMLVFGFACAIPFFCMIFLAPGWMMYLGICMYSFFACFCYVTSVTMTQELLPGSVGFASGLTLGLCVGVGGVGAGITGWAADVMGSLPDAMFLLVIPTILCPVLALFIRYPEKGRSLPERKEDTRIIDE
ncbi:MAG: MFS transporter [Methanospirillum sp.]|nr:MFS transporter [Methanospirillum sp.]